MEIEIRLTLPQAKECLEPPEPGGGKEGFPPRAGEGVQPCQHLGSDFWPPELWENQFLFP
jgi:hypothetical protein